jgi:dsRNA-specific ribonuclease
MINNEKVAQGRGSSKQLAEKNAAQNSNKEIGNFHVMNKSNLPLRSTRL